MKFYLSLCLLTSAVVSQQDFINSLLPGYKCNTPFECNSINLIFSDISNLLKIQSCLNKGDDNEKLKCSLQGAGLSNDQASTFIKWKPFSDTCSKLDDTQTNCVKACSGDDKQSCVFKCFEPTLPEYYSCMAKKANLTNFDSKKAIECDKNCKQTELSDYFTCDYKCNESLYKKFTGDKEPEKMEKKDTQTATNTQNSSGHSQYSLTKLTGGLVVVSSLLCLIN